MSKLQYFLAMSVSHLCDKYSTSTSFRIIQADLENLKDHLETLSVIFHFSCAKLSRLFSSESLRDSHLNYHGTLNVSAIALAGSEECDRDTR